MEKKQEAILAVAEDMIRRGGYNQFSFREIAKKVGIKSSSVHYYFPTKEDLGVAVVRHYTDRFLSAFDSPAKLPSTGAETLRSYINAFRNAVVKDQRMCLCGVLSTEVDCLPTKVRIETKLFFERNLKLLESILSYKFDKQTALEKSKQILSLLEGALMMAKIMDNVAIFDQAVKSLDNL